MEAPAGENTLMPFLEMNSSVLSIVQRFPHYGLWMMKNEMKKTSLNCAKCQLVWFLAPAVSLFSSSTGLYWMYKRHWYQWPGCLLPIPLHDEKEDNIIVLYSCAIQMVFKILFSLLFTSLHFPFFTWRWAQGKLIVLQRAWLIDSPLSLLVFLSYALPVVKGLHRASWVVHSTTWPMLSRST